MPKQERDLAQFKKFVHSTIRTPLNESSYRNKFGRVYNGIHNEGFTKEDINEILASGDVEEIRELSKFFSRFSGVYARTIQYYSSLLNYTYAIVPHYDIDNKPNKKKIKKASKEVSQYLRDLNPSYNFPLINKIILQEGVYYGFLKETEKGKPIFFQLPPKYCRSRFKDENGLHVLELDSTYFDIITNNEIERKAILSVFPKYVQTRYQKRKGQYNSWIEIPPVDGGICFAFDEYFLPPMVAASSAISDLQGARDNEAKRDAKALDKLLIQKLPIDKTDGELLFSLDEAAALHEGACNMVANEDTIDVLTTYADIKLENVQDPESASNASTNRINKYVDSVYDELGIAGEIFNPTSGSTALTFSIKKDIAIMFTWSKQYQVWVNAVLKEKAKTENLYFTVQLFPTTSIFQADDVDMYLKIAQYGYPKTLVANAIGLDNADLMQLSHYENEVCNMIDLMRPLQSSYTTADSGKNSDSSEKSSQAVETAPDLLNEGGRPNKTVTQRSDKTVANRDGAT